MTSRSKAAKKVSPAPGISLSKTKKGAWSIRRAKIRAFAYITDSELKALCAETPGLTYAEAWTLFKAKKYIIAPDRMSAERAYAQSAGKKL